MQAICGKGYPSEKLTNLYKCQDPRLKDHTIVNGGPLLSPMQAWLLEQHGCAIPLELLHLEDSKRR